MLILLLYVPLHMASTSTVTIKVDSDLKKRMDEVDENWSAYLREAIKQRISQEERRKAARELLMDLQARKHKVPPGSINAIIREARDAE
jgi:predicted transcriptional regulator